MWKRSKWYKKSYKNYHNNQYSKQQEDAFWTAVTILAIWALLWALLWLWIIAVVYYLLYWTHKLNRHFKLYDTRFFYAAILSFLISLSLITVWWNEILINTWKINKNIWDMAIEGSNYVNVNGKWWKLKVEPNYEWIAEKTTTSWNTFSWSNK